MKEDAYLFVAADEHPAIVQDAIAQAQPLDLQAHGIAVPGPAQEDLAQVPVGAQLVAFALIMEAVLVALAAVVTAGIGLLVWRGRLDRLTGATIASLGAVFLCPGPTEPLGLPLALLALGGLGEGGGEGSPS